LHVTKAVTTTAAMTAAHDATAADPSAAAVVAVAHLAAARVVDPAAPAEGPVVLAVDPEVPAASVAPAVPALALPEPWAVEPRAETPVVVPSRGIPPVVPPVPNAGMADGMAAADLAVVMSAISVRNR
jgi:hypothetical protein